MDEEDLREVEETRQLQTPNTFSGFGAEHDERRKDALMELFRPSGETKGVQLLKKMGWKEGQHIGQKRQHTGSDRSQDSDSVMFRLKNDRKGLGFDDEEALGNSRPSAAPQKDIDEPGSRKTSITRKPQKSAFGVGVLNDTGSDDEDPYSMGPTISYNRVIGGDKKPKKKSAIVITAPNPALRSKPVFLSKKLANLQGSLQRCHDGRSPLEGFVLGDDLDGMAALSLQNEKYRPPDVPGDWKSSLVAQDGDGKQEAPQSVKEAAKHSSLDAKTRASLLGEAQLPGKSIFDYLSPAARNRLAQASGKGDLPPAMSEKPPDGYQSSQKHTDLQALVPKLDQDVALQALNRGQGGWMPYGEDEAKQSRYRTYLEIRAGLRLTAEGDELPPRAEAMRENDWVVEMQEFARAAQVFKPVTGDMASRFTSSTTQISNSADPDSTVAADALITKPRTKPEDPAETAAKLGMFGQMTRSSTNFYPTRLLCKRFGVPMPEHASQPVQTPAPAFTPDVAATVARSRFQSAGFQADEKTDPQPEQSVETSQTLNLNDGPNKAVIDPERNEALEKERPGQALFKALFGSDDEDDDD